MSPRLSARSIRMRNERINGKRNIESLDFMTYVRNASTEELQYQQHYARDWQRIAIDRELVRREGQKS